MANNRLMTEVKDIARSMITASHYNNLPEEEFESYLNSIIAKTRKLTLQEVGEWLEQRVKPIFFDPAISYISTSNLNSIAEALKRGEMPE